MNKLSLTQQKEFLILKVIIENAYNERRIVSNHHIIDKIAKNKLACVDG
ncbi:hypothetical protein [Lysinibacillus sp. fls2-241-R2A-57]|nr:hypothetical protein [Lysinibacillus sp. fls2-241-R2A-57]